MGEDADNSRVMIGKYIGPKLYVTYAQDLAAFRGREVTVEYELLPQLTLEAQTQEATGTDKERQSLGLFWKTEW